MSELNLLGSSKVSANQKITIIKKANKLLQVKEGDIITFYADASGNVVIKGIKLK